jgi:uncharacterized protein (DUF433 family)
MLALVSSPSLTMKDPRTIPLYSIDDAARYLRIPSSTIRSLTSVEPCILSFMNLVEIHVLRAIHQTHQIQLNKLREALDYLDNTFKIPHPLATEQFRTEGMDLFVERYGALINASTEEQLALKDEFILHLERIEADDNGLAIKLYPFTRSHEEDSPKSVVIDPRIAFGRLVIANTGIPTSILKERYWAGESIDDLAYDYECDRLLIEEAIRCELPEQKEEGNEEEESQIFTIVKGKLKMTQTSSPIVLEP